MTSTETAAVRCMCPPTEMSARSIRQFFETRNRAASLYWDSAPCPRWSATDRRNETIRSKNRTEHIYESSEEYRTRYPVTTQNVSRFAHQFFTGQTTQHVLHLVECFFVFSGHASDRSAETKHAPVGCRICVACRHHGRRCAHGINPRPRFILDGTEKHRRSKKPCALHLCFSSLRISTVLFTMPSFSLSAR